MMYFAHDADNSISSLLAQGILRAVLLGDNYQEGVLIIHTVIWEILMSFWLVEQRK